MINVTHRTTPDQAVFDLRGRHGQKDTRRQGADDYLYIAMYISIGCFLVDLELYIQRVLDLHLRYYSEVAKKEFSFSLFS